MNFKAHPDYHVSVRPQAPATITSTKCVQVIILCHLMFLTGSTFSLGVFTLPVEHYNIPPVLMSTSLNASTIDVPPLRGAWPFGMGLMHFLSAPVLIAAGFILDNSKANMTDGPLRILSLFGSLSFLCFALCAAGVYQQSRQVVTFGLAMQAVPLGVYYPLVTELLLDWLPDNPGRAVGLSQLSFGLGSIGVAWFYSTAIQIFDTPNAIIISAFVLALLTAVPSLFLAWPCPDSGSQGSCCSSNNHRSIATNVAEISPGIVESVTHDEGLSLLHGDGVEKSSASRHLSWTQLVFSRPFTLYLIVVLTAGVSYAFIPYYFKLGALFDVSHDLLLFSFQITSIASTFFGLLSSIWTDHFVFHSSSSYLKSPTTRDGPFSSGAKNMMGLFLIIQTVFSFLLIPVSRTNCFALFVVIVAFMKMIMASHAGCAALIARDIFGEKNSCLTFGIGGGLALGSGEGLSAAIMTWIDSGIAKPTSEMTPAEFNGFYWIAGCWSVVGTVSLMLLHKYRKAFLN